jgi:hypothetical protein
VAKLPNESKMAEIARRPRLAADKIEIEDEGPVDEQQQEEVIGEFERRQARSERLFCILFTSLSAPFSFLFLFRIRDPWSWPFQHLDPGHAAGTLLALANACTGGCILCSGLATMALVSKGAPAARLPAYFSYLAAGLATAVRARNPFPHEISGTGARHTGQAPALKSWLEHLPHAFRLARVRAHLRVCMF